MEQLNDILKIPERCLVHKKITKAFFKRNFELTSQEKNLLDDPAIVASIDWIASISPNISNVPAYKADAEDYEEVLVIAVKTTEEGYERNRQKIAELVQKYIPYYILLAIYTEKQLTFNTCEKKINQNDNTKRTIDKRYFSEPIIIVEPTTAQQAFLKNMDYAGLNKTSLKTLYDDYNRNMVALQSSQLSGMFVPRSYIRSKQDMLHLEKIEALEKEIVALQSQARKETQMNQRVKLSTLVQDKRKELEHYKSLIVQ